MDRYQPAGDADTPLAIQRLYRLYLWVLPALSLTLAIAVALAVRTMYDRSQTHSRLHVLLDQASTLTEWSSDLSLVLGDSVPDAAVVQWRLAQTLHELEHTLAELQQVDQHQLVYPLIEPELTDFVLASSGLLALSATDDSAAVTQWYQEQVLPAYEKLTHALNTSSAGMLSDERRRWRNDMLTTLGLSLLATAVLAVMIARFIKDRRSAEVLLAEQLILKRSEERLHALIRNSLEVLTLLSPKGEVLYSSQAVSSVLGYDADQLIGASPLEWVHPEDQAGAVSHYNQVLLEAERTATLVLRVRHADGTWRHIEAILTNLLDDPNVGGILLTYRDVTKHKQVEVEMLRLAYHDTLTDLPNRALFRNQLDQALERADKQESTVALLFLDLDNFKVINDSVGHQVGDQLLVVVAERLRKALRPHVLAARLGGDEFVVLAQELDSEQQALALAEQVACAVSEPFILGGHEVTPSCSIGVALRQPRGCSADTLLRNADTAMYKAKAAGRQQIILFEEWMNRDARDRLELEIQLRKGLERGEFLLHFQPCVDLRTGEMREIEALVRWDNPFRGHLSPGHFIPLAEETGLIHPLGAWVLAESCRQMKAWQEAYPSARFACMNVNVSVAQLFHPDFLATVERTLRATGLSATSLRLEITESVIMHDTQEALRILTELRNLGVSLAVDDFGQGYSNLRYLKLLPIDVLKVDRAFVEQVGVDEQDTAIVEAIVTLAKTLRLKVIAEGVETSDQAQSLRQMDCDLAQGYYFARPMSAADLEGRFGPVVVAD